jgi:hypothetical protein
MQDMNGYSLDVGMALGRMLAEQARQTEILLSIVRELRAGRFRAAPGTVQRQSWAADVKEVVQAAIPIVLIMSMLGGKIATGDALALLKLLLH